MAGSVSVNVRLFALYRERLERDRLTLTVPAPATVAAALAVLADAHPRIGLLVDNTMVAVNLEYVDRAHALEEGDEVALIPPVSGGQGPFDKLRVSGPPDPARERGGVVRQAHHEREAHHERADSR